MNARIDSFELAFRMQAQAPAVFDLANETEATKRLYGIGTPATDNFGKECLLARRLVENGVRFVQIFDTLPGNFQPWDLHGNHNASLRSCAARTDRPIAGLLKDLKQRGLLEDTLVIWGGEFGRTPRPIQADGTRSPSLRLLRCGWPAAACAAASPTEQPTTSATPPWRTAFTSTISMPRSCICSAWTIPGLPTATQAAISA